MFEHHPDDTSIRRVTSRSRVGSIPNRQLLTRQLVLRTTDFIHIYYPASPLIYITDNEHGGTTHRTGPDCDI